MTRVEPVKGLSAEICTGSRASFSFSPASGKAAVSSRMRLGKTQDVVAVAQMSDGKFYMAKRTVKVTIGGCGG